MANKLGEETIPVTVHVSKEDYKRLRSSLILKNRSFSKWVRIIMHDFLDKLDKQQEEKQNEQKLQETKSER